MPDDPLAAVLELSGTPLAIADAEGRILSANPALASLLGRREGELAGRRLEELGLAGVNGKPDWEGELGIRSASGSDIPCRIRLRRYRDQGQDRLAVAFADLRPDGSADGLRHELALVRPLEGLGRLLSGFAHDLSNVLQIVMGHGELAQRRVSNADPRLIKSLGFIADAASRGAAAAEALMALNSLRQPARAEHRLSEVVRAALSGGAAPIPDGVEVRLRLSEPGPVVLGDELGLRRVVEELVRNAVAAMAGAGVLELATETVEADAGERVAEILVRDTGTGIPPEIVDALQAPSVVARNGTRLPGLGLAVVDRIVRDHHGKLDVITAPGQGTTIRCRFPVAPRPARQ